jgi:integrase
MPRSKTGGAIRRKFIKNGKTVYFWYARIQYEKDGKRVQNEQKAPLNTKTSAKELAKEMVRTLEGEGEASLDAASMTFKDLAAFFVEHYLVDAEYEDNTKVKGYRSKYEIGLRLEILKRYFGSKKIKTITHGTINKFRSDRISTPVVLGKNTRGTNAKGNPKEKKRSIGTVNKELGLLRRVLNVAVENGWILKNPFSMGRALINPSDEKHRERIINKEEEERLLAACVDSRYHLRLIVIMALDTGMRRGEMMKLKWGDIDFENREFTIQALNTKTIREREGGMSKRLYDELLKLYEISDKKPSTLVFKDVRTPDGKFMNPKKSYNTARRKAGLPDVRFHDLRHTHGSRLASLDLSISEIARQLGHTQINTTYRYLNTNKESRNRVVNLIDKINEDE